MKILITGACGFVGFNLARHLTKTISSAEIYGFDNLSRKGAEQNPAKLSRLGVTFVHGDVRSPDDLGKLPKFDIVIHAAAEPSVLAGDEKTAKGLVAVNFVGTLNVLDLVKRDRSPILFISSSRVYSIEQIEDLNFAKIGERFELAENEGVNGVSVQGFSEAFSTDGHKSLYGSTKICSEEVIREYSKLFGFKYLVLRSGLISGPGQFGKKDQGVVSYWLNAHLVGKPLSFIGFGGMGHQVRDVLHIYDLCELVEAALTNSFDGWGEVYNVGGGLKNSVSLAELTRLCEEVTNKKIEITSKPEVRNNDIRYYVTDNTKLIQRSGWVPSRTPREVLTDIMASDNTIANLGK